MTNGKAGDIGGSPPVKDTMQLRNLPPQVLTGISQVALGLCLAIHKVLRRQIALSGEKIPRPWA